MSRKYSPGRRHESRFSLLNWLITIALGVILVGVGLGVAYAFTPLHDWLGQSVVGENAFLAPRAKAAKKVGADTQSVVPTAQAQPSPAPLPTAPPKDARFAFLLLGYGGGGHDGTYLTDSIMVVIVDPERKTLTLLSIPRDSWVPMSIDGKTTEYNKINTAYAFAKDPTLDPNRLDRYGGDHGAGNFATDTISRLVGVPIQYYLALDFQGFRDMIDAVGGVDVEVPDSFSARYPANDDPSVDASWKTVKFTKGAEHMNGERAIEFSRAREVTDNLDEGSDFARSRRQRIIMQAFKTRLFEPGGMIHLPQLLGIASKHVDTNYAIPDVARLSQFVLGWKNVAFYQTALTAQNFLDEGSGPDGTYILYPSAPDRSWGPIQAFVHRLWDDPGTATAIQGATIVAENASGVPGAAGRVSDGLMNLGYLVADPITAPRRATSVLIDKSGGKLGPVIDQLKLDLRFPDLEVQSDDSDPMPVLILEIGADAPGLSVDAPDDSNAPRSDVGVETASATPVTTESSSTIPVLRRLSPVPSRTPTPLEARAPTPTEPRASSPTEPRRLTSSPTAGKPALSPHPAGNPSPTPPLKPPLPRPSLARPRQDPHAHPVLDGPLRRAGTITRLKFHSAR